MSNRPTAECFETCCECDGLTDRAGRGEDSLYCEDCEAGPFCNNCFDKHTCAGPADAPEPVAWRVTYEYLSATRDAFAWEHFHEVFDSVAEAAEERECMARFPNKYRNISDPIPLYTAAQLAAARAKGWRAAIEAVRNEFGNAVVQGTMEPIADTLDALAAEDGETDHE